MSSDVIAFGNEFHNFGALDKKQLSHKRFDF